MLVSSNQTSDPIATQLAAMVSKLEVAKTLKVEVVALKIQSQTYQHSASNTINPRDKERRKRNQKSRENNATTSF